MNHVLKKWRYLEQYKCYYLEHIAYCSAPTNPECQTMNIYVPAAYLNEDGTKNDEGIIIGKGGISYCHKNAPILYWNNVGGYAETKAVKPGDKDFSGNVIADNYKSFLEAGYVVAAPGSRGKETIGADGTYTGRAPHVLVDLKAGIRFLRHIKDMIPGDMERIITVGVSAGGALSSMLGVSGNCEYYEDALRMIGAVMDEKDHVFASQIYCPIIDLENSDMSYEWMYHKSGDTWNFLTNSGTLNEFQKELSVDLANAFPAYINSKAYVDEDGNILELSGLRSGSYYDYFMNVINEGLNTYLRDHFVTGEERYAYVRSLNVQKEWIGWKDGTAIIRDLDDFTRNYSKRIKSCPADDGLDRQASGMPAQGSVLGSANGELTHYSVANARVLEKNREKYRKLDGFEESYIFDYQEADKEEVKRRGYLMNPMNFVEHEIQADKAKYVRICVGSQDADESFSISMNLALVLKKYTEIPVEYVLVWNQSHGPADYPEHLENWIENIMQKEEMQKEKK